MRPCDGCVCEWGGEEQECALESVDCPCPYDDLVNDYDLVNALILQAELTADEIARTSNGLEKQLLQEECDAVRQQARYYAALEFLKWKETK
jgi:hypothetical protein